MLNELHLNIQQDRAADWESRGHWRLSGSSPANANFDYRFPIPFNTFSQNGTTIGVRATLVSQQLTRTPILPAAGGATQSLSFVNLTATAAAAGVVDALISFWEYDLEQLAWYPAHSAINVVTR